MTLKEEIRKRLIRYYLRGKAETAYELAVLYFWLSKEKIAEEEAVAACIEGFYWLRISGCRSCRALDLIKPDLESLRDQLQCALSNNGLEKEKKNHGSPDLV